MFVDCWLYYINKTNKCLNKVDFCFPLIFFGKPVDKFRLPLHLFYRILQVPYSKGGDNLLVDCRLGPKMLVDL